MKYTLTLTLSLLLTSMLMQAQVTIGSAQMPNKGALLDLKEWNQADGKANSTRGLALPRVKLTVANALTDISGATGTGYEGLIVYNIGNVGGLCPGIHAWDGMHWVAIGDSGIKPDITMTDTDGNTYNAKWFSENSCDPNAPGAYWTTSNLYTTKDKDGLPLVGGARLNPAKISSARSAITITSTDSFVGTVSYGQAPNQIVATNKTVSMKEYAAKFGLGYTWPQAKLACPANWHLPSDEDWDALIRVHGGAADAGNSMRPNNDYYLPSDREASYMWGETDTPSTPSGFAALPSGMVNLLENEYAGNFGTLTYWWSGSANGNYQYIESYGPALEPYTTHDLGYYFSARCVKD